MTEDDSKKVVRVRYVSMLIGLYYALMLTGGIITYHALMYNEEFAHYELTLIAIKQLIWYMFLVTAIMLIMIALKLDIIIYAIIVSAMLILGIMFIPILYNMFGFYIIMPILVLMIIEFKNKEIAKAIPKLLLISFNSALFALQFSPVTIFIFFTLFTIFDIIAVYISKHMVTLATSKFGDMLTLNVLIGKIGFGDFMLPMAMMLSFTRTMHPMLLYGVTACTAIGLMHLIVHIKPGKFYPALPPVYITTMSGIYLAHAMLML
jgi:presenilin-like A22 family membrane protease